MGFKTDLESEIKKIFRENWTTRDGQKVPETEQLKLSNEAILLDATVLYADLTGSTNMVDNHNKEFAAEIYKSYLIAAARIINLEGGIITAYDGDRVMAVFIGKTKNTDAARCALRIRCAVINVINPSIINQYPDKTFQVKHVVGIDTSKLFIARTGIRGANDLVWVGRAANYAAKLTALSSDYSIYITETVFNNMLDSSKFSSDGRLMWTKSVWEEMRINIYKSNWWWGLPD